MTCPPRISVRMRLSTIPRALTTKGAPGLRRRFAGRQHVFADATFPDVDAEFESFAVDAGCTPTGILSVHLADQISDLARKDRSSRLAMPHVLGPQQPKARGAAAKSRCASPMQSVLRYHWGTLLTAALASPGPKPYAPPMKPRVIQISKTSIKITGIIRDAKTGKVINTEETMDAMYKYLVKRHGRKTVRDPKR